MELVGGGRGQQTMKFAGKDNYLEFIGKWAGSVDDSARTESLPDAPPIVLLLTAPVQPVAWYLCIFFNYHRHTAPSIELLQEAAKLNNLVRTWLQYFEKTQSPAEAIIPLVNTEIQTLNDDGCAKKDQKA